MKIKLESVFITDLDKALSFYTNVLGFVRPQPPGDARPAGPAVKRDAPRNSWPTIGRARNW